ncbi:hypothetical protein BDQ12DRAFT_687572 [Crucibulum laeve]|uniref:TPR-like protein n=1 Tax=Crucibulum laeve TaxID=68775 RepID=A0A5C3LV26_9AGAR|nr:hypothetical protein BDQ12DRAFT_687572 [Crucibulum laeve]
MSNPAKERHYWVQLRSALTSGQWLAQAPSRAPNGAPLSWSELLRKFNKHCRGSTDVAEVASQTYALSLLLAAGTMDEDGDVVGNELELTLDAGDECVLASERIEEATAGYEALKKIQSSNFDTINFALAYYAYALNNPAECLAHLERIPDILQIQNHIPTAGSMRSSTTVALTVPGYVHGSSISSASATASFASLVDSSTAEIRDGRGWAMTETFRSICLKGMAYERLSPSEPQNALNVYRAALTLFPILSSEFASPSISSRTTSTGKVDSTHFSQLREMWRWVERLLYRAIVLSAQTCDVHSDVPSMPEASASTSPENTLWEWLNQYTTCSVSWPPNFRTAHRSAISMIYLYALVLRYSSLSSFPAKSFTTPLAWTQTARTVIQDYRAILSCSTTFPRAGTQNIRVEVFVDLCVAVWEASGSIGASAGWIIDVLWWATRYTFNSSRILRHMTRLLHLAGDTPLAKRTLKLYVQVVGKAWEAAKEGVGEDIDSDKWWVEILVFGVKMLCRDACALTQGAGYSGEGLDEVKEAGTLVEKARSRLDQEDKRLVAAVEEAEGIYWTALAVEEQDHYTRPLRLSTALAHFRKSIEIYPTSSGHFHLSLALSRAGPGQDLTKAIEHTGAAVEGEPSDVRYWHLLGLLLSAQEKWSEAREILERGADLDAGEGEADGEVEEEEEEQQEQVAVNGDGIPTFNVTGTDGEVQATDFGGKKVNVKGKQPLVNGLQNGNGNGNVSEAPSSSSSSSTSETGPSPDYVVSLVDGRPSIPSASSLLHSILDPCPPSKLELFEYSLQLRMTQAALIEVMEGAEGAEHKWVEVFSWVADQNRNDNGTVNTNGNGGGSGGDDLRRRSMDSRAFTENEKAPTERPHIQDPEKAEGILAAESLQGDHLPAAAANNELPPPPIPITISPATPDERPVEPEVPGAEEKSQTRTRGSSFSGLRMKRSTSIDRETTKSKTNLKVGKMLKHGVHKGQARLNAVSRRIGSGVVGKNGSLKRSNSTPDFHAVLRQSPYQASSIHSRRRVSSVIHSHDRTPNDSPPPPPPPPIPPAQDFKRSGRAAKEKRLISDLWLMSAATFRRLGKIEQAKGSIQEAEVRDEDNPAVWVQLGLYYAALGHHQNAVDALQKALFTNPDDISATVHLSKLYLEGDGKESEVTRGNVDLAAGMLSHLTRGRGWDIPEAWYFLAKAYRLQGRSERERKALENALELSERRGVRDTGSALGWCI